MTTNRVNITLTAEQSAGISTAVDALETALPDLISLSGEESRKLFRLGDLGEAFVLKTLEAVRLHPELFPTSVDLAAMDRDQKLRETLRPIRTRLQGLVALVDGTYKLAGADLMTNCSAAYRILQVSGVGAGVEDLLADIGQRFDRGPIPEPEVPAPAGPPQG